jgi:4-diphosphocytidyl-2-C-methyl-D-erythritol kinase
VRTCAKVNLCLRVLGRRPDGYHDVQTIMQAVALWDFLRIAESGDDGRVSVRVTGEAAPADESLAGQALGRAPLGQANLCWRAAEVFGERTGARGGVTIELTKSIPAGAGLGGGSSDAAATLAGMARLRGLELGQEELEGMAAEVGSDVPFFLRGGCCLAQGRGERLEALPGLLMWLVLVVPEGRMLTAQAYAALERPASPAGGAAALTSEVRLAREALERGDLAAVAGALHNDFGALEVPELAQTRVAREKLVEAGCLGAAVSGSGTTAFGIAASRQASERIAEELRERWGCVRVARTLGPGEGMVVSDGS